VILQIHHYNISLISKQ